MWIYGKEWFDFSETGGYYKKGSINQKDRFAKI